MLFLLTFSFLAGAVTILSPCILPILPIVLSSAAGGGRERPLGIIAGFIVSFTFFTLFLTTVVKFFGFSPDALRILSVFVILFFGLSILFNKIQTYLERLFSYFSRFVPRSENKKGFVGGFIIGLSIGLLWTPCVGPILASVIALALTGSVTFEALLITLAYSLGTAIPMLAILYGGQRLLTKTSWLLKNTNKIQKIFGVIMIITAISIYYNYDRKFQSYILEKFPNYGVGLTKLEDNDKVKEELENINSGFTGNAESGRITSEYLNKAYEAPEIVPGGEWFNTNDFANLPSDSKYGVALKNLKGKVVLIDFWTYTCINCIRTLPYLKTWNEKYKDKGLVIIGVHTPEFEFEKDPENVEKAISDFDLEYPIIQDNNYATWRAYKNRYWPAKYLIDKDGRIRYNHFGEGSYDQTEQIIQNLLKETGASANLPINNPDYKINSRTPELYLGYDRMEFLDSPESVGWEVKKKYSKPQSLHQNYFAFEGEWTVGSEYTSPAAGSKLYLNFDSQEVFLVMKPKNGQIGKAGVWLNGEKLNELDKGQDVHGGLVEVDADRLYKLIHLESPGVNELMLEFLDDNLELFAFTFG